MDYVRFTEDEINRWADDYMSRYGSLERQFEYESSLTSRDITIMLIGSALQTARWFLLSHDKFRFTSASEPDRYIDRLRNNFPSVSEIANHSVPYDAIQRSSSFQANYPGESVGLSGSNHRLNTIGHEPVLGLIFGTMNIATGTLTTSDFSNSYVVVNQQIHDKTSLVAIAQGSFEILRNNPSTMGAAFAKQIIHMGSDVFTKQGLPLPAVRSVSYDTARDLAGNQINVYSTTRNLMLAVVINKVVEMIHRAYYDGSNSYTYAARTAKVVMYSNTLASVLNLGYTGFTKDFRRLDVGGFLETVRRVFSSREAMLNLRRKFISDMLDRHYQDKLNESRRELERLGIYLSD